MKKKNILSTILACAMITAIIPIYNIALDNNYIVEATSNVNTEKSQQLIDAVNQYREKNGLKALKTCDVMNTMANVRAKEVVTNDYTTRPNGNYYSQIFTEYNITPTAYNQNVYWGSYPFDTVEVALQNFQENERQNKNLLSTEYEYIGIGVVTVNNYTYYYQLFCTSKDLPNSEVTTVTTTSTTAPIETTTATVTTEQTTPVTTTETTVTTSTTTPEVTTTIQPPIVETTIQETLSDEQLQQKYNLDVNKDGKINTVDMMILKKYILGILYN